MKSLKKAIVRTQAEAPGKRSYKMTRAVKMQILISVLCGLKRCIVIEL